MTEIEVDPMRRKTRRAKRRDEQKQEGREDKETEISLTQKPREGSQLWL